MRRLAIGLSALLVFGAPSHASAASVQGNEAVFVEVIGCQDTDISVPRLLEMLRAEVAPHTLIAIVGIEQQHALGAQVFLCHGSPRAARLVLFVESQPVAEQVVDLSDVVGELRSRTVAVTFAEMLSTVPQGSRASSHATPPVQDPPASASTARTDAMAQEGTEVSLGRRAAPTRAPNVGTSRTPTRVVPLPNGNQHLETHQGGGIPEANAKRTLRRAPEDHLGAGFVVREYIRPASPLLGPWLDVQWAHWIFEAQFLTLNRDTSLGEIDFYNGNLALAYRLLAVGQSPVLALRARAELGAVWAKGTPQNRDLGQGRTTFGFQGAALLEGEVVSTLAPPLGFALRLSAGAASGLTATSDGKPIASTNGAVVGAALGLLWDLGVH